MTRSRHMGRVVILVLLAWLVVPCMSWAQPPLFPRGCYGMCEPNDPIPANMIANRGLVGVHLTIWWKDIEPAPGVFDWSQPDARIHEAQAGGLKVELSITATSHGAPDWIKHDPGVQKVHLIDVWP